MSSSNVDAATNSKPPAATTSLTALEVNQNRVDAIAQQITDVNADGFAGLVVSPETTGLTLYWHGTLPANVQNIITNATQQQVVVTVQSAPYTQNQLKQFQSSIQHDPGIASSGIQVIEVNTAGDGVTVAVSGSSDAAKKLTAITNNSIPVTYQQGNIQAAARWKDTVPFWGGAWITNNADACTSGFGAHNRTSGENVMLTAGHCFEGTSAGTLWFAGAGNGALGLPEGSTWGVSPGYDAGTLDLSPLAGGTPGGGGGTTIYAGTTDTTGIGTGESSKTVKGASANNTGDFVNVSGAYSGETGGNKITNNTAIWTFTVGVITWFMHGSEVNQTSHLGDVGFGDSGSPVYTNVTGGVSARGLFSAFYTTKTGPCQGAQVQPCGWDWFYGDINGALSDLNLALNVG
jgi:hypothetical protein